MTEYTQKQQESHDRGMMNEAKELQEQGWKVQTQLNGFDEPPVINTWKPDIFAAKDGSIRIVEIETDYGDNFDKHLALWEYAKDSDDKINFLVKLVDQTGQRISTHHINKTRNPRLDQTR